MGAGQPRTFPTPEDMDNAIDKYITKCQENKEVPYMKDFCLGLGKCSDLFEFYKTQPEYSRSIKRLKEFCEYGLVKGALKGDTNAAMSIFLLKNNHGMKDKVETENTNQNINQTYEEYRDRLEAERKKAKQEKRQEEEEV